jgi:hypothetical protein
MPREIIVEKKSRDGPLVDRPIKFDHLENLHLELMENKKKLKKNLPLIPVISRPAKIIPIKKERYHPDASDDDDDVIKALADERKKDGKKKKKDGEKKEKNGKKKNVPESGDEDEEDEDEEGDNEEGDNEDADSEDEENAPGTSKNEEDDGLTPEQREVRDKEEYIWRFRILKKQYKNKPIPEYNEHDDLEVMKTTYNRTLKELQLEDNVESYRMYLVGGFMVMEFVCTTMLNIDMKGFSSKQMKMMHKYDRLLVELGEKSRDRWGMNLPVEIRLIGLIIFNAAIFYLGKLIESKGGTAMADLFNSISGQREPAEAAPQHARPEGETPNNTTRSSSSEASPRRMRGPTIRAEDITRMNTPKPTPEKTAPKTKPPPLPAHSIPLVEEEDDSDESDVSDDEQKEKSGLRRRTELHFVDS